MLKETVTYVDFNEETQTEDLYFNLTKHELIEMALELPDGVAESVSNNPDDIDVQEAAGKLMDRLGNKGILQFIKDLVLRAYGVKSADGKKFMKVDENGKKLSIEFSQSLAFDAILDKLMSTDEAASNFVNNIIPSSLADKIPDTKPSTVKKVPAAKK